MCDADWTVHRGGITQRLGSYPDLAVATVQVTAEHSEAVGQCPRMSVKKRFLFDGVALDAANISPRHIERSAPVKTNLAYPGLAFGNLATVPAGKTPHPLPVELLVELPIPKTSE